jgi:hypothetical protein
VIHRRLEKLILTFILRRLWLFAGLVSIGIHNIGHNIAYYIAVTQEVYKTPVLFDREFIRCAATGA